MDITIDGFHSWMWKVIHLIEVIINHDCHHDYKDISRMTFVIIASLMMLIVIVILNHGYWLTSFCKIL